MAEEDLRRSDQRQMSVAVAADGAADAVSLATPALSQASPALAPALVAARRAAIARGRPGCRSAMNLKNKGKRYVPKLDAELIADVKARLSSATGLSALEEDVAQWVEDYKAVHLLTEDASGILSSGLGAITNAGGAMLGGLKSLGKGMGSLAKGDISGALSALRQPAQLCRADHCCSRSSVLCCCAPVYGTAVQR